MKKRAPWRNRMAPIPDEPPKTPQETALADFRKETKLELGIEDIVQPPSPSTCKKHAAPTVSGHASGGTDGTSDSDSCSDLFACPGQPSPASAAALGDYYRDLPPARPRPKSPPPLSGDKPQGDSLVDQLQEEWGGETGLEVQCLLAHTFPKAAFSVTEEEAVRNHFQRYWEEEGLEETVNEEWTRRSVECLRKYRQQLKGLRKYLRLALGEKKKLCSPEVIVRLEAVTVALGLRLQEAVPSRKKRLIRSANDERSRPGPSGLDGTSSGRSSPPNVVLQYAVHATEELIRAAEKVSAIRRPRGRRRSQEARQGLVARLLMVRCNQYASGRKPRTRARELVNGLTGSLGEIELPCVSGPHMQEWGRWATPMDGETLVGTREDALRQWLLRRILAGDVRREAFLSKEQIALLLVASGITAMPPEPSSGHSDGEDPDDGPGDPSVGGRAAKDEALDMVRYDVEVLRGTAQKRSARRAVTKHDKPLSHKAVLYIRYRNDSDDKEETCLQFHDCRALVVRVRKAIEAKGGQCRRDGDCLYTTARNSLIEEVLAGLGDGLPKIIRARLQ